MLKRIIRDTKSRKTKEKKMKHKKIQVLLIVFILLITSGAQFGLANIPNNLVIHDVDITVNEAGNAYTVELLISALDSDLKPLTGLTQRDITLIENGQPVEVNAVEPIKDQPINIIMMIDNSFNMRGARIRLAKNAVIEFINTLNQGDSITIYTFNPNVLERVSFTKDLNQAREDFRSTELLTGFSACLFDAVYHAVQVANTYSPERQAIIVLSGGPDRSSDADKCSEKTVNQILNLALEEENKTPIYTIGVGENLETDSLERLSEETHGMYFHSRRDTDLANALMQVSNRLASQYLVRYTSYGGPGQQKVAVQVEEFANSIEVDLPGLPPVISIAFPLASETIDPGMTTFVLNVVEQGIKVDSLAFMINDAPIDVGGALGQPPYEYEVDLSQHAGREITLSILAMDQDGVVIAQTDRLINLVPDPMDAAESDLNSEATQEEALSLTGASQAGEPDEPICPTGRFCWGPLQLTRLQLALGGLVVVFLTTLPPILIVKKRSQKNQADSTGYDKTIDGFMLPMQTFGKLSILASDDPKLIGKEFELSQIPTTIGRSINNDIALPVDSAVSRNHLEILPIGNDVIAREMTKVLKDGTKQPPTYGTYVNDRKIIDEATLATGDEIRLGPRTKLQFEAIHPFASENEPDELTLDELSLPSDQKDEATRDG
jgi:VWFA-related protein